MTDLGGFQFGLSHNPIAVHVDGATLGDFLGSGGRSTAAVGPVIDNESGHVTFAGFSYGDVPGASGDGVLATLSLTALGPGATALTLEEVQVLDTKGQLMEVTPAITYILLGNVLHTYLPLTLVR